MIYMARSEKEKMKCRNCKKEIKWNYDKNYCESCYPDYIYHIHGTEG